MPISSAQLRQQFLSFFAQKGHQIVSSSPLLPKDDPTLLFINAGMAQFKDVFTGREKRPYTRATTSQKCVRAGGKHNDLENVGRTARHHTLFEMLGNFSFGDYFKQEACLYAWEFLTQVLKMDASKLSITVFGGEGNLPADEEAERIWRDVVGVPAHQISRKGAADNFWAMGDTGPCGPCTEIHYDRGNMSASFGGDDAEGDRIMEFWNLVFMQYEKKPDGSLVPLPAPSVDTGMGLERLCTILNGLPSNYDTDLLRPLVEHSAKKSGKTYQSSDSEDDVSMRVIADHSRATAFLLADGVLPSNEGRGYVLRRIMRRAIRHGSRLGFNEPFFHETCDLVVDLMGSVYPELQQARAFMNKVVLQEEEAFRRTLQRGLELFSDATHALNKGAHMDGAVVFKLYETYGFPPDLTTVLAEEKGLHIDWSGFEKSKTAHEKASAGELGLTGVADIYKALREELGPTRFVGEHHPSQSGRVLALIHNQQRVSSLAAGQSGAVILDQTPFYGESGGQVGDTGTLENSNVAVNVLDTKKIVELHVHQVSIERGQINLGDQIEGKIDEVRRQNIKRHHSVTHLLHAALRETLGDHVIQKGSLVAPERLRFDFSHFEPLSAEQTATIERRVNEWILENQDANAQQMSIDVAKSKGAMALFGEKYGDEVRVVQMGPHSIELCGGTHVHRTGDIGCFRITSEGALASGVRRIEAVAGILAYEQIKREQESLHERIHALQNELKSAHQQIAHQQSIQITQRAQLGIKQAREINHIRVVTELVNDLDTKALQEYADKLRDQLGSGIVVLGTSLSDQKCSILVALTKDLTTRFHAGKMVTQLAETIGGKGGGRPDFAQAGGTKSDMLAAALAQVDTLLSNS